MIREDIRLQAVASCDAESGYREAEKMSASAAQQGKYGGRDGRSSLLGLVALACLVQTGCLMDREIDAIPVSRVPKEILVVDR